MRTRDGESRASYSRDGESRTDRPRDGESRASYSRDGQPRADRPRDGQARADRPRGGSFRGGQSRDDDRPGSDRSRDRRPGRGPARPGQSRTPGRWTREDGRNGQPRSPRRQEEATDRPPRRALPELPDGLDEALIAPGVRSALSALRDDVAARVARYLLAAETEEDADRAYEYAHAARTLAARIGVVREVAGVAAYRAGKWAEALAELRAARRLTGRNDYLPIMADSERALGRHDRALAVIRDDEARKLDRAGQIELRIVESGIRRDQGRPEAAVLALRVPELTDAKARPWTARLLFAYAEALLASGDSRGAREALERAAAADASGETGAVERLDELDGITIDDLDQG
jgi:hypothetical protein